MAAITPSRFIAFLIALALGLAAVSTGHARLGESTTELVRRFGEPRLTSAEIMPAQGTAKTVGKVLQFRAENWLIEAVVIDDRCEKISYRKPGGWHDAQFDVLLKSNAAGLDWEVQTTSDPVVVRTWLRGDGAFGAWMEMVGLVLTSPRYQKENEQAVAQSRASAPASTRS